MRYTETALNQGLDAFEDWRKTAMESSPDKTPETENTLIQTFRNRVEAVIAPESPTKAEDSASLVFLSAAGREMYNFQKETFLRIFSALSLTEKGDLIAIYKAVIQKDTKQSRIAKLIPELERLLNAEIDAEKRNDG